MSPTRVRAHTRRGTRRGVRPYLRYGADVRLHRFGVDPLLDAVVRDGHASAYVNITDEPTVVRLVDDPEHPPENYVAVPIEETLNHETLHQLLLAEAGPRATRSLDNGRLHRLRVGRTVGGF